MEEVKSGSSIYIPLIIIISAIIFVLAIIVLFLLITNPSITLTSNDLQTGKRLELRQNSIVKFSVMQQQHEISINKVAGSYVNLTINSPTIKASFKVGETKSFDLTDNDINEFEIKLVSIIAGKATLSFKQLSDSPPPCSENWVCTSFNTCINGSKTRNCTDFNNCGTLSSKPPLMELCCSSSCSNWTNCNSSNIQTRSCSWQGNCSISQIPLLNQSCTYSPCTSCSAYQSCINNTCVLNNCPVIGGAVCASTKKCNLSLTNASDTTQCCLNSSINCINKTYSDYGYALCDAGTNCLGNNVIFEGTSYCNGTCISNVCGFTLANKTSSDYLWSVTNNDYALYLNTTGFNCTSINCPEYFITNKDWIANFSNITYNRYSETTISHMIYDAIRNGSNSQLSIGTRKTNESCFVVDLQST